MLDVLVEGLRHVNVNDKAHIPFVDAHAKGYGCDNDLYLLFHPFFLDELPLFFVQACVVMVSIDTALLQKGGELLCLGPGSTREDARFSLVAVNHSDEVGDFILIVERLSQDLNCDIGSVEGALENQKVLIEP